MNDYLFNEIKKIASSYGITSDVWCRKELAKWEHYDSWSDKFNFDKFIRNDCKTEQAFTNHYGMDYDETMRRIKARQRMKLNH